MLLTRVFTGTLAIVAILFAAPAYAQSLTHMIGTWNHDATGENVRVESNWDIFLYSKGQARISSTTQYGSNIVINGPNYNCYYYVTFTNNYSRMNWQKRSGNDSCLTGTFNRTSGGGASAPSGTNTSPGGTTAQRQPFFSKPRVTAQDGRTYRVDVCYSWDNNAGRKLGCGKYAAFNFCQRAGFSDLISYGIQGSVCNTLTLERNLVFQGCNNNALADVRCTD